MKRILTLKGAKLCSNVNLISNDEDITFCNIEALGIDDPILEDTYKNITIIKIDNNHTARINNNSSDLEHIIAAKNSTILLDNNTKNVAIKIQLENNSKLIQTGIDLLINSITLSPNSEFSFTYKGTNYSLSNKTDNDISIEEHISNYIVIANGFKEEFSNSTLKFTKKIISNLKFYEKEEINKEILDLLLTQNGFSFNVNIIESYIKDHYFELTNIADQALTQLTLLKALPYDMLQEITSYLKLDDIKIAGDEVKDTALV